MGRITFGPPEDFEWLSFLKSPIVGSRLVSIAFSTFILILLNHSCYYFDDCVFNKDKNACNWGIAVSFFCLMHSIGFLYLDVLYNSLPNKFINIINMLDLGLAGILAFFNFVSFCYLTNKWNSTEILWLKKLEVNYNSPQSVIAFTFFHIFVYGSIIFFTMKRKIRPNEFAFSQTTGGTNDTEKYVDSNRGGSTYPGFTSDVDRIPRNGDSFGLPLDH